MEFVRDNFLAELKSLLALISHYELESSLLAQNTKLDDKNALFFLSNLRKISTSKRKFNYNSLIISLYGFFEKFIENLLISYADKVNNLFTKYTSLPQKVTESHYHQSITFLKKIDNPKYKGPYKKEDVIANLHSCLNINEHYTLNKDAFAQHSSNYRIAIISESFDKLGIEQLIHKLKTNHVLAAYFAEKYEAVDIPNLTDNELFKCIDDLADRRNEVAHGVPGEILSNGILRDYIDFHKAFAHAIVDVLNDTFDRLEVKEKGVSFGRPVDVYKKGNVIVINNN